MRLSFFEVRTNYCDYLRKIDYRVPYNMEEKHRRPFVGVVFKIGSIQYFAPLSSPKIKHMKMKNQIDFIKIEEGKLGAINLNNMMPVPDSELITVNLKILEHDDDAVIKYKKLLANQLTWCNANKNFIVKNANKLYNVICSGNASHALRNRCCDYVKLEDGYKDLLIKQPFNNLCWRIRDYYEKSIITRIGYHGSLHIHARNNRTNRSGKRKNQETSKSKNNQASHIRRK